MAADEKILAFVSFTWDKPFFRYLYRFWEMALTIRYHLVLTNRRLILVRVSNPYDTSLIGGVLFDGLFYNARLKSWRALVIEGDLDGALRTSLKKEVYMLGDMASLSYDARNLAIQLKNGRRRLFRLEAKPLGGHVSSMFPNKLNSKGGWKMPLDLIRAELETQERNFVDAVREFNLRVSDVSDDSDSVVTGPG